jgi:hypothetical protein
MRGYTMKKTATVLLSILFGVATMLASSTAFAEDMYFAGSADTLSTVKVYEVPDGKQFILGSVIIGNVKEEPVCCGRLLIGLEPNADSNFLYVGIPPTSHFEHNFSNVVVQPGESIWFRNGSQVEWITYTITGELVKAKK